jgi:DNA repair protein RadA/Sms
LLLQACVDPSGAMLYVSGEESMRQIAIRAERLGIDPAAVTVYSATQVEDIIALAEKNRPACVVIDSVQTVYADQIPSAPGSVSQLRECTARLVRMAKVSGISVILDQRGSNSRATGARTYGRYGAVL